MICVVFVASIGWILWPVDKACSRMVLGKKCSVPELPRSSLARCWLEATLLHGWAQIEALGYAIAWVST